MKILLLILHLLPYVPTTAPPPVAKFVPATRGGTGTLLIAACQPGTEVVAEPGHLRGAVGRDGVARIQAPAQDESSGPYRIGLAGSGYSFDMNGTLSARESLSAVCP